MAELFSTFGIDWRLLLIQSVNFGLLLLALWYFLYRPVLRMIEERRQKIEDGVRSAEAADKRLEETARERDEIVGKASREAEDIISASRETAEKKGSDLVAAAHNRADGILSDAAARAEEAKRQALSESEKEIARAAVLAAEKIMRERATK